MALSSCQSCTLINAMLRSEVARIEARISELNFENKKKKIMEEFRFYLWLVIAFSIFTIRRIETPHDMGHYVLDPESPNSGHVMMLRVIVCMPPQGLAMS